MNRFIKVVYLASKSNINFLDLFEPNNSNIASFDFMLKENYCRFSEFPKHNYLQYIYEYDESLIRYCFNETENKNTAREFKSYCTIEKNITKKDFLSCCNKLVSYIRKYNKFLDI